MGFQSVRHEHFDTMSAHARIDEIIAIIKARRLADMSDEERRSMLALIEEKRSIEAAISDKNFKGSSSGTMLSERTEEIADLLDQPKQEKYE